MRAQKKMPQQPTSQQTNSASSVLHSLEPTLAYPHIKGNKDNRSEENNTSNTPEAAIGKVKERISKQDRQGNRNNHGDNNTPEATISRRQFLSTTLKAGVDTLGATQAITTALGTALGTTAAGAGSLLLLTGCEKKDATATLIESAQQANVNANVVYLDVVPEQIIASINFEEANASDYLTELHSFDLPLGCLVFQDSNTFAVVLQSMVFSKDETTLARLNFLDLNTGDLRLVLNKTVSTGGIVVIYDARANDSLLMWVECDIANNNWKLYGAALGTDIFAGFMPGSEVLLDEGDHLYDPPQLCVCGKHAYWTVMPNPTGAASNKDSYLKRANAKDFTVETIYTSHGRMITNPQASNNIVTFVPRVNSNGVTYQLTALDDTTGTVKEVAILPQSLRVGDAVYLDDTTNSNSGGFSFTIEGNYDYAKGLQYFGTYGQVANGDYFYANKTPSSAAAMINNVLFVKSTKSVIGFDVANSRYFVIEIPKDCVAYGDVLAASGVQQQLVLYTSVRNKNNVEKGSTRVRVFAGHN